ncbi:MAG: hypothetical protein ABR573_04045 [Candidatus Dormibacteria bacterium]
MSMKRLVPTLVAVAFLLGALSMAVLAGPFSQAGKLAAAAVAAPKPAPTSGPRDARSRAACDAFLADFAHRLGVPESKVKDSLRASALAAVDRAVKNGEMTEEQATKARTKINAVQGCQGLPAFGRHPGPMGGPPPGAGLEAVTKAAATALGVTPADLRAAIMAGKSLHDVAGPNAVKSDFDTKFRAALTAELQPQVAAGKLTADQLKSRVDAAATMADRLWDSGLKGLPGPFGRHRGPGAPPPGAPVQ